MPYYREYHVNRTQNSFGRTSSPFSGNAIRESAVLLTHRAKPHRDAIHADLIADHVADPYAHFLQKTATRKYQARLAERGMNPEGTPDQGHAFSLVKHTILTPPLSYSADGVHNYGHFVTPRHVNTGLPDFTEVPVKGTSGLDVWARDAFGKVAPSTVEFDAAQFLGELREGLPRIKLDLWKKRANAARAAGSDYLNVQFGWIPLISELHSALTALAKASFALQGVNTRSHRRWELPPVTTNTYGDWSGRTHYRNYGYNGVIPSAMAQKAGYLSKLNQQFGSGSGEWSEIRTVKRWFEGEFTLFTPLGFNPDSFLERLDQMVALELTPKVLWELAPWSWLVDWNLKVQDAISSAEAAANDKLIMHYGYAMEHVDIVRRHTVTSFGSPKGVVGLPKQHSHVTRTQYKTRLRANPFGFGFASGADLTDQQWSILMALGLSNLK